MGVYGDPIIPNAIFYQLKGDYTMTVVDALSPKLPWGGGGVCRVS